MPRSASQKEYLRIDNHSTLSDGSEKINLSQVTILIQVKELKRLKKKGVKTDFGGCLELYLLHELAFEAGWE